METERTAKNYPWFGHSHTRFTYVRRGVSVIWPLFKIPYQPHSSEKVARALNRYMITDKVYFYYNQSTLFPCFTFMPITGTGMGLPEIGVNLYWVVAWPSLETHRDGVKSTFRCELKYRGAAPTLAALKAYIKILFSFNPVIRKLSLGSLMFIPWKSHRLENGRLARCLKTVSLFRPFTVIF